MLRLHDTGRICDAGQVAPLRIGSQSFADICRTSSSFGAIAVCTRGRPPLKTQGSRPAWGHSQTYRFRRTDYRCRGINLVPWLAVSRGGPAAKTVVQCRKIVQQGTIAAR